MNPDFLNKFSVVQFGQKAPKNGPENVFVIFENSHL